MRGPVSYEPQCKARYGSQAECKEDINKGCHRKGSKPRKVMHSTKREPLAQNQHQGQPSRQLHGRENGARSLCRRGDLMFSE